MPRNMENSNPRLLLSEILRKVSNAKTKKEKVDLLRKHNSNALRQVLIINFDERAKRLVIRIYYSYPL